MPPSTLIPSTRITAVATATTTATTTHVTTHIHTDGPIPGPHSLLTLTSVAYRADGVPIGSFAANLRELPGSTLHPVALEDWRRRAEDWLCTRRAARPPGEVANAYATWVCGLGGRTVFVTDPDQPDHLFCYWYLQRFAGRWPFAGTVPAATPASGARRWAPPTCPLSGCRAAVTDGAGIPALAG